VVINFTWDGVGRAATGNTSVNGLGTNDDEAMTVMATNQHHSRAWPHLATTWSAVQPALFAASTLKTFRGWKNYWCRSAINQYNQAINSHKTKLTPPNLAIQVRKEPVNRLRGESIMQRSIVKRITKSEWSVELQQPLTAPHLCSTCQGRNNNNYNNNYNISAPPHLAQRKCHVQRRLTITVLCVHIQLIRARQRGYQRGQFVICEAHDRTMQHRVLLLWIVSCSQSSDMHFGGTTATTTCGLS
jgi:hypothetical protein